MSDQPDQPVQPPKKNTKKNILIILGSLLLLCVICAIFSVIFSNTPEGKAAAAETSKQKTLAAMVETMSPTQANTAVPDTPLIPTPTDLPSATPLPMLGLDLGQFIAQYDARTDLQKKQFVAENIGKWITWSGVVDEVSTDGTVRVDIPETLASSIYLKGISKDIGITLQKGMQINFSGRLSDVNEFLGLHIYVDNAQIIQ